MQGMCMGIFSLIVMVLYIFLGHNVLGVNFVFMVRNVKREKVGLNVLRNCTLNVMILLCVQ